MDLKTLTIILFVLTYIILLLYPKYRAHAAVTTAAIFVLFGIVDKSIALTSQVINWNVLLMILGTMGVVTLFIESKMPSLIADIILEKSSNFKWAIIFLCIAAGLISAFIDNVATVLMFAPVALEMCKKQRVSPVAPIIAISVSSNLQGAATLVGDATSILLGAEAGMNFWDFFFYQGKIGLFWVVQTGALVSVLILMFIFRHETQVVGEVKRTQVNDYFPSILLFLIVLLLIIASFIPNAPVNTNGFICMSLFFAGLANKAIQNKSVKVLKENFLDLDFETILLLASLFIMVYGLKSEGVIDDVANFFFKLGKGNVFLIYTIVVWCSVIISAFVDNIPYVGAMLPVMTGLSISLGIEPTLLYFGLIIGATLGGNLTPIGASANITGIGILRKEGYEVSTAEFMKIGVPFTLAAATVGYLLIFLIWF